MGALDKKLRSEMQLEVVNILEQLGTPDEIYEQPATRFAAEFVGRGHTGYEDMDVILALRPEKLVISK